MSMLSSLSSSEILFSYLHLAPIAIADVCSFGILGQFISPPIWRVGIDVMLAGNLGQGFAGLKLSYY